MFTAAALGFNVTAKNHDSPKTQAEDERHSDLVFLSVTTALDNRSVYYYNILHVCAHNVLSGHFFFLTVTARRRTRIGENYHGGTVANYDNIILYSATRVSR